MTTQSTTGQASALAFSLDAIVERQKQALYPELLSIAPDQATGAVYYKHRAGTGLIVAGQRHSALTESQKSALDEFRLDQYSLCGFYDLDYLRTHHIERDPDLLNLPADTIHIVIGTQTGRILAYSYIQPPYGTPQGVMGSSASPRIGDAERPWLPCEAESFGPDIFSSLPALRSVPTLQIAEVSVLLRNQLENGPQAIYAVAESILAMALIQADPVHNLLATVAYCGHEARQFIFDLGMTAMYAPYAPVIRNGLPSHWSLDANMPGRFWPSVFSSRDFQRSFAHLETLDEILSLPASDLRRALVRFRQSGQRIIPAALMPEPGSCEVFWITTPEVVESEAPNAAT